jgi:hypothetical protein
MKKIFTEPEIAQYIELKEEYLDFLSNLILEKCNKIVQIGAYTADLGEFGMVRLSRNKFPMQFTEKTAKEISEMSWQSNTPKKPIIKIFNVKDWYKSKIETLNKIIAFSKSKEESFLD